MNTEQVPPAHIRLFRREVLELMTEQDFDRLKNQFAEEWWHCDSPDGELRAKASLFRMVAYSEEPSAIEALKAILARSPDPNFLRQVYLRDLPAGSYVNTPYMKLLIGGSFTHKLDRIAETLEPEHIVKYFSTLNSRSYDNLISRVNYFIQSRNIEDAACELLRSLPYCYSCREEADEWYYDFIEACLSHGETRFLPRYIDPDYEAELSRHKARKKFESDRRLRELNATDLSGQMITEDMPVPTKPRDPADYVRFRDNESEILSCGAQADPYQLRSYQNELVQHANKGRSTIVCAPTGSGKTLVAVDIILNHLERMERDGLVGRVVMLVPTVPLVDQQTERFLTHMLGRWWVDGISGTNVVRHGRVGPVLACNVVVMTPQLLINMLNSVLVDEKLYLSDFTLMVFDECHHCTGDHPYKVLTTMLEESDLPIKPQIVGLTASMGVGRGRMDIAPCREHMLELCSNLRADSISTVRNHLDELQRYVSLPIDRVVRAKRPADDRFVQLVQDEMLQIEHSEMRPLLNEIMGQKLLPLAKNDIILPKAQDRQRYQGKTALLRQHIQRLEDQNRRLSILRCIDHLSHYYHAIGIAELLPYKYALEYLEGKMHAYRPDPTRQGVGINNRLLERYVRLNERLAPLAKDERTQEKDILDKLYRLLNKQYTEKPESRTLIFVSTRTCAIRLSEHLNEQMSKVRNLPVFYRKPGSISGCMTSSNATSRVGGMSADLQRQMRERFENGELKVLVVTSVAEEGLDIMACNLIIKYNSVGSERSLVQRRGRARAHGSESILLALDTSVEVQEFENMEREALMMHCIKDFQARSDEALSKMIAEKRRQIQLRREQQKEMEERRRERLRNCRYQLNCRDCNTHICDSMDIRLVADHYYVCCDPTIYQRSIRSQEKKPSREGMVMLLCTLRCAAKDCGREWGSVVNYGKVFLPALTAKAFVMQRFDHGAGLAPARASQSGQSQTTEKWAKILEEFFNVEPIGVTNISQMLSAMAKSERVELERLEAVANQEAIDEDKKKRRERFEGGGLREKYVLDE